MNPAPGNRGSIATGMAMLTALGALAVVTREVCERRPRAVAAALCATPVEIVDDAGERLGCADDPLLTRCGNVGAGERVRLPGCERGSMSGAMRLLVGLPLDLNVASVDELALIDGIGPRTADAIVRLREERGRFGTVDELVDVRGIGEAMLARLRPLVSVGRRGTTAAEARNHGR